jgi:hypothetical protein
MADDEKSPKPFSPVEGSVVSPTPASRVESTEPVQNVGIPGAAPLPPVQLKIHDFQYSQQEPTLRPITINKPEESEDEDDEDVGARPMFDIPNAPANWPIWVGAVLLMLFFIAAAIWMMYKVPSN